MCLCVACGVPLECAVLAVVRILSRSIRGLMEYALQQSQNGGTNEPVHDSA